MHNCHIRFHHAYSVQPTNFNFSLIPVLIILYQNPRTCAPAEKEARFYFKNQEIRKHVYSNTYFMAVV